MIDIGIDWPQSVGVPPEDRALQGCNGAGLVPPLVNFALPFLIYTIAKSSLGNARALLIASSPPIAWTIIGFARTRRIDALLAVVVGVDALTPDFN